MDKELFVRMVAEYPGALPVDLVKVMNVDPLETTVSGIYRQPS